MGQNTKSKLTLNCMAIGSLPHKNSEKAMELVEKNFFEIPFWAQLTRLSKNEDMIVQFLENMPSLFIDEENGKTYLETESDKFFEDIEQFFCDYEEIISDLNCKAIEKYAINYSKTFHKFTPHYFIDLRKKTYFFLMFSVTHSITVGAYGFN